MPELARADVHGNSQVLRFRPRGPKRELLARRLQCPLAQRQNQPAFLGCGNEVGGCHQPTLGVLPAQQGLDAGDVAEPVHLRLVVQDELLFPQPDAKIRTERRVGADSGLQLGIEEADGVAPHGLGLVHRQVGLLEQFAHTVVAPAQSGDADARGGVVLVSGQIEGFAQLFDHLFGHHAGARGGNARVVVQVFEHDDEFVAAQARHRVALAHAAQQPRGDLLQQQVALVVAQGVVKYLEVVQVDEHQGTRALRPPLLQPLQQQQAIGQPGQRIVKGQMVNLVFGRLALGDVASHRHPVAEFARRCEHRHNLQFNPEPGAALLAYHQLAANLLVPAKCGCHAGQLLRLRRRSEQHASRLAEHFVAAVAGMAFERIVDEHDARGELSGGRGLGDDHDVVEPRNAGLQQHQLLLRLAPLGDVAKIHRQAFGERVGAHFQPLAQAGVEVLELDPAIAGQ